MKKMNQKKFKLPKEFWEKWKTALLSGEYVQGDGFLGSFIEEEDDEDENYKDEDPIQCYCCLGVAAICSNISFNEIRNKEFINTEDNWKIVDELKVSNGNISENLLVAAVSRLNDGVSSGAILNSMCFKDCAFRLDVGAIEGEVKFNFRQIVEFIEDNTEFY
jgi:hypothetical protein